MIKLLLKLLTFYSKCKGSQNKMKTNRIFVIFVLFIVVQLLEAGGGSEESQKRRDTCGALVKPYPPKSDEQSGEQPSTAAAPLTTLNPTTDQKTVTYATTVDGGVCVCDQSTVSGITVDYTNSEENDDFTNDQSTVSKITVDYTNSEENDDFTNDSDKTTSGGSITTSKPWTVPSCDFTKYMWNISLSLSYEYQIILQEWIYDIEYKYISQYELYSEDELVVLIGYSLKHFSLNYTEVWKEISFEKIGSWGYCADFISVSIEIQLEITAQIVELSSDDNCNLFEAIRNATKGNDQAESDCEDLIAELTIILKESSWSYEQKLGAFYAKFQYYFEYNSELKVLLIENCQIEGFGSFESFFDVCLTYERTTTLSVVIGGSTSECILIKDLEIAYSNTSIDLTVRNQIKQLHDKIKTYFETNIGISLRLKYVSEQCYSFFGLVEFNVQFVSQIQLSSWGTIFDLEFCSHICTNYGCGNPNDGAGSDDSTTLASTPSVTTEQQQQTTQEQEGTTEQQFTVEPTPTPADCSKKNNVVMVQPDNTTWLITNLQENYNNWNLSTKTGFNSYFNKIKSYSYQVDLTIEVRVSNCITTLKQYNANNLEKQKIVMDITITQWYGTIGQFCSC